MLKFLDYLFFIWVAIVIGSWIYVGMYWYEHDELTQMGLLKKFWWIYLLCIPLVIIPPIQAKLAKKNGRFW